jgi:hypothetical protein
LGKLAIFVQALFNRRRFKRTDTVIKIKKKILRERPSAGALAGPLPGMTVQKSELWVNRQRFAWMQGMV